MRYEVKRIADLMDSVLSQAEMDAFRNGASKNARGFDRYDLKRSLSSHRSPERLTVMQRLLDRLSAESTESLLGR
jgi:flagellar motor switch protein FliM